MKRGGYTLCMLLLALILIGGMILCDQPARTADIEPVSLQASGGRADLPRLESRLDAIARAAIHPY
ncbi:MAG: hypothetical protein D6751_08005 [Deltaproteobacteria bacterium]|nr:MAG: hypothetical protein D6751_08005 [Deltaproteobacteria bacterium]